MSDQTVAKTILQQLGGNRFIAMTGAKDMVFEDNALSLSIRGAARGIKRLRIILGDDDLYTVEFWAKKKDETFGVPMPYVLKTVRRAGWEDLKPIITSETGLDTHL